LRTIGSFPIQPTNKHLPINHIVSKTILEQLKTICQYPKVVAANNVALVVYGDWVCVGIVRRAELVRLLRGCIPHLSNTKAARDIRDCNAGRQTAR